MICLVYLKVITANLYRKLIYHENKSLDLPLSLVNCSLNKTVLEVGIPRGESNHLFSQSSKNDREKLLHLQLGSKLLGYTNCARLLPETFFWIWTQKICIQLNWYSFMFKNILCWLITGIICDIPNFILLNIIFR